MPVIDGHQYSISCQAKNSAGYSLSSEPILLDAGIAPIKPYDVLTELTYGQQSVEVTWKYTDYNCPGWRVEYCYVDILSNNYE